MIKRSEKKTQLKKNAKKISAMSLLSNSSSDLKKAEGKFVVNNSKGMHTRPCTELVKCATHFKSQVFVCYKNVTVSAKSLLGLMALAAGHGAQLGVYALGEDANEAINAILQLASMGFYIPH